MYNFFIKEMEEKKMEFTLTQKFVKDVNKWLKANGFSTRCELNIDDNEFYYDEDENVIGLGENYDSSPDSDFVEFLRKYGLTSDFDAITLSILHEIGHSETLKLFTEKQKMRFQEEIVNINLISFVVDDKEEKKLRFQYWEVPHEYTAQLWVVFYTNCFSDKVQELEDIIGKYL